MDLQTLIKMWQTLKDSLAVLEKEIETRLGECSRKSSRVYYYCKNRFVEVDPKALAMAYVFMYPDITIEELADKVGVSRQTIYNWKEVAHTLAAKNARDNFDKDRNDDED